MNRVAIEEKFLNLTLEDMIIPAEWIANILLNWKKPGVVLLTGVMGSGKTTLTRLILQKLGITETVNSPTFALMNEYSKNLEKENKYFHFDFYRIHREEELIEMGFNEIWGLEGHSFIEWHDKFSIQFPYPRILVQWIPTNTVKTRSMLVQVMEN